MALGKFCATLRHRMGNGFHRRRCGLALIVGAALGLSACGEPSERREDAVKPKPFASRDFAGPGAFPPTAFAGYGIVAFPQKPDTARGGMFCDAFTRTFQTVSELVEGGVERTSQMVTVWPIDDAEIAARISEGDGDVCGQAVAHYDLGVALGAIDDARRADPRGVGRGALSGRGPFLLAWSPGETKGAPDALVLVSDLSNVSSPEQALEDFRRWRAEIQDEPGLWANGWSLEAVQVLIQRWSDRRSAALLSLLGLNI